MKVASSQVLDALHAGHLTISQLANHFRGITRLELLARLYHLRRSGQVIPIGNHRRHNIDRRWRITESSNRPRGRTNCQKVELAVWRNLQAVKRQTIRDLCRSTGYSHPPVRRALLDLERQGAARRDAPPKVRRTWIRGNAKPSCLTTRAPLGTRSSLLAFLAKHPGVLASSILHRWTRMLINGAVRAGSVGGTRIGVNQALWLADNMGMAGGQRHDERANSILAVVGAGSVPVLPKSKEDSNCLLLLIRNGWLEGDVARVSGYGLIQHRAGSVTALEALRAFVRHHGALTLASLSECRPMLYRRLQHQDAIPTAMSESLIKTI